MLTNSQKEHLTYTIIGQVFTLVILGLVGYQYIYPGIQDISAQTAKTKSAIETYNSMVLNGMTASDLQAALTNKPERAELLKIIQSDPENAKKVMQKDNMSVKNEKNPSENFDCGNKEYLDCLRSVLGRADEEKENIKKEKAKLNSIIPTMSPVSNSIEENNISLRDYVLFIERDILRKYDFDTNIVIGFQGMNFGKKGTDMPESIGTFDIRLDFKASNKNILDFIKYINNTGEPSVLTSSGTNFGTELVPMSNPLITMENLSLTAKLDMNDPNKENSGRATIRFYVRGLSQDDLKYLGESIKLRKKSFEEQINNAIHDCEGKKGVCETGDDLKVIQSKVREFFKNQDNTSATVTIYSLTQDLNTLKNLETEFNNLIKK